MTFVPLWCLSVGLVYISFLCSGPLYSCASGSPFINISLLLNFKARQSSGWQLTAPAADQRPVFCCVFGCPIICADLRGTAPAPLVPTFLPPATAQYWIAIAAKVSAKRKWKRNQLCKCACVITSLLTSFRVWFACLDVKKSVLMYTSIAAPPPEVLCTGEDTGLLASTIQRRHCTAVIFSDAGWYPLWLCIRRTTPPACHVPITCTPSVMED